MRRPYLRAQNASTRRQFRLISQGTGWRVRFSLITGAWNANPE